MINKGLLNYRILVTHSLSMLFIGALTLLKSISVQASVPSSTSYETTIVNPPVCSSDEICSITRPVLSNNGTLYQIPFQFKYRPAKSIAPTVVFISGGPGDILSPYSTEKYLGVPDDFGVILIDPRFTGINKQDDDFNFTSAITSRAVADDILFILKALNINDYILYGVSYGTVPATIAAAIAIENPPRAIILDGTVARSFKQSEYSNEFYKQWNQFTQTIDPIALTQFKERVKYFIRQNLFTADDFGNIISALIAQRYTAEGTDILLEFVAQVAYASEQGAQTYAKYFVDLINEKLKTGGTPLFHALILCREISPDSHPDSADFSFNGESNELKPGGRANCAQYAKPKQINLFDSKQYQVSAPIVYLQGESDSATPISQSLYHFKNQNSSKEKYFVYRPNGRHSLLNGELKKCNTHFWEKLSVDVESSTRELIPCGATINPNFTAPATN